MDHEVGISGLVQQPWLPDTRYKIGRVYIEKKKKKCIPFQITYTESRQMVMKPNVTYRIVAIIKIHLL